MSHATTYLKRSVRKNAQKHVFNQFLVIYVSDNLATIDL